MLDSIAPEDFAEAAPRSPLNRLLEGSFEIGLGADARTWASTRVNAPSDVRACGIDNKHAQAAVASRTDDDAIDVFIAK
ncbi:MAG TPA: hypothetical protein PKD25_07655, partial [Rubrivivax sp.]|nr:hypothetical protein [Rubrivivax sp.]